MAIREQKGWVWTAEEKEWIKTWEREVKIVSRRLSEQVDRFHSVVPAFAEEAVKTAQPFLTATERLLALADGAGRRKYQPLSPDEAKLILRDVHAYLSTWSAFTHRPDVQAAIRGANRQIRAHNSAVQKQRREARAQLEQHVQSAEFAQVLDGYVDLVFHEAAKVVTVVQGFPFLGPVGNEADQPALRRLVVIDFIRACTLFNAAVRQAVEPFVQRQPPPPLSAVVRHTIAVVIQDHCHYLFSARSGSGPHLSVQEVIQSYLHGAVDALFQSVETGKKAGRTSPFVSPANCTLFGVDYSLAAHPASHPAETRVLSPAEEDALYARLAQDK